MFLLNIISIHHFPSISSLFTFSPPSTHSSSSIGYMIFHLPSSPSTNYVIIHQLRHHPPTTSSSTNYVIIHQLRHHPPTTSSSTNYVIIHQLRHHPPTTSSSTNYVIIHQLRHHQPTTSLSYHSITTPSKTFFSFQHYLKS